MANILQKAFKLVFTEDPVAPLRRISKKDRPLKTLSERELIELESQIGRQVFGPLPTHVVRREFFNLDDKTWIWHEHVKGEDGVEQELTTRYEIQPRGILKIQPGPKYSYLEDEELYNFVLATKEYYERVTREIYKRDPQTGQLL